ncbi:hypothetical protein SK854_34965 [Lentzea sp. BCCO 10_0061]|uniref:SUKH-4 immunity protein of toxin-antitoxin system n=1 Tax=Lentzea sokolovensis TaxID=3095429 RepID=A0ABU4V6D8_9PSEU|nr:hypothetical protein [Lentzea sp. BCCO 10_0061]MDX8147356.1 hypothetical protein [Lentzea sp. BCCO 10_0061]
MPSLIAVIANDAETARFLAWPGDFELDRADHVEEVHLASGAVLEGFAGDGAGGTYFFCGDGGEERPVLYADSEGGAALVAIGLRSLLQLLLVAPWWRDFREFTEQENSELAAEYLNDMPDLPARQRHAADALGLGLPPAAEVVARLRETATGAGPEFDLVFTPEQTTYERLFQVS